MTRNILSCLSVVAFATLAAGQMPWYGYQPYVYRYGVPSIQNGPGFPFGDYMNPFSYGDGYSLGQSIQNQVQAQMQQMQQQLQQQFEAMRVQQERFQKYMHQIEQKIENERVQSIQKVFDTLKALDIAPENITPEHVRSYSAAVSNGMISVSLSGYDSENKQFKIRVEDEETNENGNMAYGTIVIKTSAGRKEYFYERSLNDDEESRPVLITAIPSHNTEEVKPNVEPTAQDAPVSVDEVPVHDPQGIVDEVSAQEEKQDVPIENLQDNNIENNPVTESGVTEIY